MKLDRAGLRKVMAPAQARQVDAVLVTALSRWARRTTDLLATLKELEARRLSLRQPLDRLVGLGPALVSEARRLFPGMTILDKPRMDASGQKRVVIGERIEEMFSMFPNLRKRRANHAFAMSGGEQQMLAIAGALMSRSNCCCSTNALSVGLR